MMRIDLITDSTLETGLEQIRQKIVAWTNRIKAYFPSVTDVQSIEKELGGTLAEINTELVEKGSTQADDYSEVAEKISDIETGITPTGTISISQNGIYNVKDFESASVSVPDSEFVGLVEGTITELYNPNITELAQITAETGCVFCISKIKKITLPNVKIIPRNCFRNYSALEEIKLGSVSLAYIYAFYGCPSLKIVDVANSPTISNAQYGTFYSCPKLDTLIIRGNAVATLQSVYTWQTREMTIYVPQALVSDYQNATNWSALENATFLPIEGSEYE